MYCYSKETIDGIHKKSLFLYVYFINCLRAFLSFNWYYEIKYFDLKACTVSWSARAFERFVFPKRILPENNYFFLFFTRSDTYFRVSLSLISSSSILYFWFSFCKGTFWFILNAPCDKIWCKKRRKQWRIFNRRIV